MALQQMFSELAPRMVKGAAIGAALTGTAGFIGARGDPRGIPAGITGAVGGGIQGLMSGGMLGAMAGAGLVGAAFVHPGFRAGMARKIGQMLGSPRTLQSAQRMAQHPLVQSAPAAVRQGIQGITALPAALQRTGDPVRVAAEMTAQYLERKQMKLLAAGAGIGALAGGVAGIPLGATQRGFRAGRQV
ncbi:MAG: hypothetical protein GTO63_06255 [Anaerolineae bacterium]|nr:hypothetical protein [Anaerolineae bacterium]NIN93605.1 hypothetical protein [Anaerolineae bacterium]NIQ77647.1 hypothetical protein [Anaerolineae bacterium]